MAVALLFTASCAKEDISSSIAGGEVEVTFTASLPELGTRAFGEGKLAKQLTVNVYEHGTNEALTALDRTVTSETGTFTFQLVLLKGMKYDIVLWAQNATCGHYTLDNKVVTMNYTGVNANDESRDAFYFYVEGFDPAVDTPSFALTRPFAQLNAAVNQSDMTAVSNSKVELTTSTVKVKTYTTLNIATGEVGGETEVEFVPTAMPKETFNTDYTLLSMNYILVPQDAVNAKMVSDVEFTFKANKNGSESAFSGTKYFNVPLKRNYRTNILGSLLTKPTDFTVTINPVFTEPAEEILVKPWDGTTEAVTPDANDVYSISNANQLAWLAEQVNAGNDFAGKTINLTNDIDLNNIPWTPIGLGELDPQFKGTLDGAKATRSGDCYVIRNLYVAPTKGEYTAAGLFGRLNGCVKNLVIDGAYIEHVTSGNSNGATTNGIAVVAGSTYNTSFETSVENVTVKNAVVKGNRYVAGIIGFADSSVKDCTVEDSEFILSCDNLTGSYDNADKGGSIVGYSNTERPVNVTGCVAKNVTITGYRDLGGIIGYARGTISGNTVEGVKLVVDNTHNYKNYTAAAQYDLGSYYGEKADAAVVENNTGEAEVVIEAIGLTWEQQAAVKNATVTLPAQAEPYVLPATIADGVTFVGDGVNTVVNVSKAYGSSISNATNVSFKNLTIEKDNTLYVGFYSINTETYIGCTIKGALWTYGNAYFEDCDFIQEGDDYNVRIYGKGNVEFKKCDFNCAYKSILIYSESAKEYNVAIEDCTFVSQNDDNKAAVQMHTEYGIYGSLNIKNSTATGFANINNGLWNELNKSNSIPTNNFEKWVDGERVYSEWSLVNGAYEVYTANGLNTVLQNLATANKAGNYTINFAADLKGTAVVSERKDVNIVIDGKNKKYDGQIKIEGMSGQSTETLLIKNVNFETSTASLDFIWSADTQNGSMWRYANNVTIEDCSFTAVEGSAAVHTAVGARFQQAYVITLNRCTATNLHSLLQAESCGTTVTVDGATIVNGKNGVSLNNTLNAIVKNSNIESVVAGGYGIRHKGQQNGYALTVTDCNVEAFVPVLVRNMTASAYTCTLSGNNTLTETNANHDWQIVICKGDYDGTAEPVAPTGNCTLVGADGFVVFGK